jgi:imidazolonepropionase-like amidohydrolase
MRPPGLLPRLLLATALATPLHAQTTVAFTGATVWDGTGTPALPHATLLVREGVVVSVGQGGPPAGVPVLDLTGAYVIPGLVNAHGHVTGLWAPDGVTDPGDRLAQDLLLYARYGVTTVNSLGGEPAQAELLRRAQSHGPPGRARLHFAGPVITATTPDEAAAEVEANALAHVDWMKIRVDDNLGTTAKMPWPVVETVMKESHERGFRVATHLFYLEDAKALLRAGSDLIAHSIRDADVDAEVVALLRERDVCYVPTLTREVSTFAYAQRPAFFDDPFFQRWADPREVALVSAPAYRQAMARSPAAARYRVALAQAQKNLETLMRQGVRVAMGTDSGPEGRFPGYFEHMELELMAEAGLTPTQVLRSATGVAAACLGLDDVGTLEPGRWADFLALDADPLADVRNTRSLRTVYVAGRAIR